MPFFGLIEKFKHYNDVAKGKKATKKDAKKHNAKEQKSYAAGYRDAVNDQRRAYKYKNSTELERQAYNEKRRQEREDYKKSHPEKYKNN